MHAVNSGFVRNVAETLITRALFLAIGFVTSVLVTRALGPEGRGFYAVATTVGTVGVQFGNLGLYASNTYFVAKDRTLLSGLLANSLIASSLIGILGGGIAWVLFNIWPAMAPLQGPLLILALTWIPLGLGYLLLQSLLLGIQEIRLYNKIDLATKTLAGLAVGLLIITKHVHVETVFIASLSSLAVGVYWAQNTLRRRIKGRARPSIRLLYENLHYGLKAYLAALFSYLVLRVDLLLVRYILGVEKAGYYSVAVSLIDLLYTLPMVIGALLFPRLSAMNDDVARWAFAKRSAQLVAAIMTGSAILAALLANFITVFIYGHDFLPTVPAFILLLPALVILSVNTVFMNYFAAIGMPNVTVYSPMVAALVNIGLNLILIPRLGIVGASVASTTAYAVMLCFSIRFVYLRFRKVSNGRKLS